MQEEALANCKLTNGDKVTGEDRHIEKMRKLHQRANEAGAKIDDSRFITKLLDSFPESWDLVIMPMYGETNLNKVIMNLTTHAERLAIQEEKSKKPSNPADAVKALEVTITALQAEVKSLRSDRDNRHNGGSNQNLKCTNSNCNKTGHLIQDCFQLGGGKAGQYPHWWRGKRTATAVTPAANMATTTSSSANATTTPGPVAGVHFALSASIDTSQIQQLITENTPIERKVALAAANHTTNISSACVADSGCTAYFFKERDVFVEYRPVDMTGQSSKAGVSFTVKGVGKVQIQVIRDGKQHTLTFNDALHAPDITANLISISKMDRQGWHAVFGGGQVRFFYGKDKVFGGELRNGLYMISGSLVSSILAALTAHSLRSPGNIATWRRRFCHFGTKRIDEAARLVDGLDIVKGEAHGRCEDCIIANQKKRPYDEEISPTTTVLWLTNIDIWGPARVVSLGGSKYAMRFHDSGTARKKTAFLADRTAETTLYAFRTYKAQAEKVTGMVMVFVHTDNAAEFQSALWQDYMRENGIKFIPTAPYSSASNGTAERSIGITTASVRTMLLDAQLSAKWWSEAWAYSEIIKNMLPSSRHPGTIPEERWTKERQDVGHIRVWGCIAYVHITPEKGGGKLGNRGQRGRLIGMEGRGIYRILIPETGQIVRSCNVQFEEGTGHRTLTPEGEYTPEYFADDDGDTNYDFLLETPPIEHVSSSPTASTSKEAPAHERQDAQQKSRPRKIWPEASQRSARLAGVAPDTEAKQKGTESTITTESGETANDDEMPFLHEEEEDETTALTADVTAIPEPKNLFIPKSHCEALDLSRRHLWYPAMETEIAKWDEKDVVTPIACPPNIKTIDLLW